MKLQDISQPKVQYLYGPEYGQPGAIMAPG